jgi:3',5'-cyclic AMP phosphodiesterase CpdA
MHQSNTTRIVCISDTHGLHDQLILPAGDILLHSGDFTLGGHLAFDMKSLHSFADWLNKQTQFKHKIVVAGNHEFCLDE